MPMRPRSGSEREIRHRKSCSSLQTAGMLEAGDLAALRIDAGHHMADDPVLAGGVHGLKDQEQGKTVAGVELPLQLAKPRDVVGELLPVILLGFVDGSISVGHCFRSTLSSGLTRKSSTSISFMALFLAFAQGMSTAAPSKRARAQIGKRAIGVDERITRDLRPDPQFRRQAQKFDAVASREIGDRGDLPLLPQQA